jgi:hypothetical protein
MDKNEKLAVGVGEAAAIVTVSLRSAQNCVAAKVLLGRKIARPSVFDSRRAAAQL